MFAWAGATFRGRASQRFVVLYRYAGSRRTNATTWHEMDSVLMIKTAQRWFARTIEMRPGGDVYCIDVRTKTVVAYAHCGEVLLDKIDPLHVYDAISSAD